MVPSYNTFYIHFIAICKQNTLHLFFFKSLFNMLTELTVLSTLSYFLYYNYEVEYWFLNLSMRDSSAALLAHCKVVIDLILLIVN